MNGLGWKFRRLRAMDAQEIFYRIRCWWQQRNEVRALHAGNAPLPVAPVGPRHSLLGCVPGWEVMWSALYRLEKEPLERLLNHEIDFFGQRPLATGKPVDWLRDPCTGIRSPLSYGRAIDYRDDSLVGNIKYVWELGRHQHLIPLAVAYARSGEPQYRDAVVRQIEGWIHDNPYGLGIHWCSSLELALRLISWALVHSLFTLRDGSGGLFDAVSDRELLGVTIYRQVHFVRRNLSRYSSANNHLIGELTGIWLATRVFDLGAEGDTMALQVRSELEREAQRQVYEDGVGKEQSFYYHLWVLEYLLLAWITGERCKEPFSDIFRHRIERMAGFLQHVIPQGGQPPQVGDADDGCAARFDAGWPREPYRQVLAAVGWVFEDGKAHAGYTRPPQKAFWYAMIAGRLPQQSPGHRTYRPAPGYPVVYPQGGYVVLGDKSIQVLFDAGPLGYLTIAAHGHADALSVCLALDGIWWLVDPGTYAYHSETGWRNYFRGTSAHNTLCVDDSDQSTMGGPFLWLRHAHATLEGHGRDDDGMQWVEGSHDGYCQIGVTHMRRVEFHPADESIIIYDRLSGKERHDFAVHFHFAPDITVIPGPEDESWIATRLDSTRKLVIQVDPSWQWDTLRGSQTPVLGWYSPSLGRKIPAFTLRGQWRGETPAGLVTRFRCAERRPLID